MDKIKRNLRKRTERIRFLIQSLFFIATNSFVIGYLQGGIYQGNLKQICVPGLNCYSCPGAVGSCPIGALQAVLNKREFSLDAAGELAMTPGYYVPFYIIGLIMMFGAVCGRFICGFLCPFGLVQDLLHKIPLPKKLKIRTFPGDKQLRYLKYVVLGVMVIGLPLFAAADPYFCKYICPSGTLIGGIPLLSLTAALRESVGLLTAFKMALLGLIVLLSIVIYRPFCKYLCPLGALYSLINPFSMYRSYVDEKRCTDCGACTRACRMGVDIGKTPNSLECIRCGDCKAACPHKAVCSGFKRKPAAADEETKPMNV